MAEINVNTEPALESDSVTREKSVDQLTDETVMPIIENLSSKNKKKEVNGLCTDHLNITTMFENNKSNSSDENTNVVDLQMLLRNVGSANTIETINSSDAAFFYCILDSNSLKICLVCKKILKSNSCIHEPYSCHNLNICHIFSDEHKINLVSLFEEYTQDPVCLSTERMYSYIVNNSCIDFSQLNLKSSFIYRDGMDFKCAICKTHISPLTQTENLMVNNLFHHLDEDSHFQNFQNNVSWICSLPSPAYYLLFYKTLFHCSICKKSIFCKERCVVRTVVHHLETNHHGILSTDFCGIENSQSLKLENTPDKITSDDDTDISSKSDIWFDALCDFNSSSQLEGEQTSDNCTDICYGPKSVDVFSSIEMSSSVHHDHSQIQGISNNSTVLDCCREVNEDTEYFCSLCEKTITCFNRNTELSIILHNEEFHANLKKVFVTEEKVPLNMTFLSDIFDSLHDYFQNNRRFIVILSDSVYCVLCKCFIEVKTDISNNSIALADHLLLQYHINQLNVVSRLDSSAFKDINPNCKPKIKEENYLAQKVLDVIDSSASNKRQNVVSKCKNQSSANDLSINTNSTGICNAKNTNDVLLIQDVTDILTPISIRSLFNTLPKPLHVQKDFFTVNKSHVTCSLCSLNVVADTSKLKNHISDITHKLQFLGELKKHLDSSISSQVKHLIFINGQLYCSLCKYYILPWSNFSAICQAVKVHFEIKCNLSDKSSAGDDPFKGVPEKSSAVNNLSEELPTLSTNTLLINAVLESLKIYVPKLEENAKFIEKPNENFYCRLCNKGISFSPNGKTLALNFNTHFESNKHRCWKALTKD